MVCNDRDMFESCYKLSELTNNTRLGFSPVISHGAYTASNYKFVNWAIIGKQSFSTIKYNWFIEHSVYEVGNLLITILAIL